jgi:biotin carboxyl carrier protein
MLSRKHFIFNYYDTLQKEHDPSKLLADTPCKLLRFLVPDGSHADADTPYAEVEVMKMCMPLLLPASGVIHFVMPEGQAMQVLFLSLSLYRAVFIF